MKIAVAGCSGRMGLTLVRAVLADPRLALSGGSEREGFDPAVVKARLAGAGCSHLSLTSDPRALVSQADAVIDFTTPQATLAVCREVAEKGGIHIVGTTGFSESEQAEITMLAKKARIVQSGNFSLGVNLLEVLTEQAARALADRYDIEIFEMHHQHKKDAPSGTALMLGKACARGRGIDFEKHKAFERNGERRKGDIGFSVARGGDVVGIHNVMFAGGGEMITLSHQGFDRGIYANGALASVLWAKDKKPGYYSMRDVLGI